MRALPSGTVTFLFTDIEGSTPLALEHPEELPDILSRHYAILREAIETNDGQVFRIVGDSVAAAFPRAPAAVAAAARAQLALQQQDWAVGPVRCGWVLPREPRSRESSRTCPVGYSGYAVLALAQRVMSAAHGGQILVSQSTAALVRDELPSGASLLDLGSHRLKGFAQPEQLWQLVGPGLRREFPPVEGSEATPTNLPHPVTSFVGREQDMVEARQLLAKTRILTLCGPVGTGKTRLCIELAAGVLDSYPVECGLSSWPPSQTLPWSQAPLPWQSVFARSKVGRWSVLSWTTWVTGRALVIFDNCEHLLAACAELADALVRACAEVSVLCTSREILGTAGETVWQVSSLPFPDGEKPMEDLSGYPAVRLFVERSRARSPGFQLTEANATAVTRICSKLDGIPLALELAAARVGQLGVEQIAARLDDRFRLLNVGSRTALPRQQTLQALFEWSYALLTPAERVLFRRLFVFAGGFTAEAAQAVCSSEVLGPDEVGDLLGRLVDKSMVNTLETGAGLRYAMLDTIRQFAAAKGAEDPETSGLPLRHARYYARLAEAAGPKLAGAERARWLEVLEAERGNTRLAMTHFAGSGSSEGPGMAAALWRFWLARGHWTEGRELLGQILDRCPGESSARAEALLGAGSLAFNQRDYASASALLSESLSLSERLRDAGIRAWAQYYLGWMANDRGEPEEALTLLNESLGTFRSTNDRQGIAYALVMIGLVRFFQGDAAAAHPPAEEGLAISREIRDPAGYAWSLFLRACLFSLEGRMQEVAESIEQSIALWRTLSDRRNLGYALQIRGLVSMTGGDAGAAEAAQKESIQIFAELGDAFGMVMGLGGLAAIAMETRREESAFWIVGAITSFREKTGIAFPALLGSMLARVEAARSASGERAERAFRQGHDRSLEEAVAVALRPAARSP